jgi:glycerol-1-phosphate dehydrogenase [NAD(P)+]
VSGGPPAPKAGPPLRPPAGGWNADIDALRRGAWTDPASGETAPALPVGPIAIADSLDGAEAALLAGIGIRDGAALVADEATFDVLGARLVRRLDPARTVVLKAPHADLASAADLAARVAGSSALIAVGSGTINDLVKLVAARQGCPFAVFATAASMNGYTSKTASLTLENGLKASLPATAAAGVFVDLAVVAAAPPALAAAGFGDCLCRPTCQSDWWLSHRLLDTDYQAIPYRLAAADERMIRAHAGAIGTGDPVALGYLVRTLILSGLGMALVGSSHPASMGEHQISHYIDCFAPDRDDHPQRRHGHQVGVATLTMARLQEAMLQAAPPTLRPTRIDPADMIRRMGDETARQCLIDYRKKALDQPGADRLNRALARIWPDLREECAAFALPVAELERLLAAAGCPTSPSALDLPIGFYRDAVRHGHEMRDRFGFADLAADSGLLDEFVRTIG